MLGTMDAFDVTSGHRFDCLSGRCGCPKELLDELQELRHELNNAYQQIAGLNYLLDEEL